MNILISIVFAFCGWQIAGDFNKAADTPSTSPLLFQEEGFDAFQNVAKQVNFPQIIFFTAPWCSTCHMLEDNTLNDPLVTEYGNINFMSYKVNVQSFEGYDIKNKYKIRVFPTILILDSKGKKLEKLTGYYNSNRFLDKLRKHEDS